MEFFCPIFLFFNIIWFWGFNFIFAGVSCFLFSFRWFEFRSYQLLQLHWINSRIASYNRRSFSLWTFSTLFTWQSNPWNSALFRTFISVVSYEREGRYPLTHCNMLIPSNPSIAPLRSPTARNSRKKRQKTEGVVRDRVGIFCTIKSSPHPKWTLITRKTNATLTIAIDTWKTRYVGAPMIKTLTKCKGWLRRGTR